LREKRIDKAVKVMYNKKAPFGDAATAYLKENPIMKSILASLLCAAILLSLGVTGASAMTTVSDGVTDASWTSAELNPLYTLSGGSLYSGQNERYVGVWWENEIPELDYQWVYAANNDVQGFAMSPDGGYCYMGALSGGTGIRGLAVFDTRQAKVTDLYYRYDGEAGQPDCPFSCATGVAADDRGFVYVGFASSGSSNAVHLGIARQMDDGTLEEVCYGAVYACGDSDGEGAVRVGVNGVDVAKVGDRYYCYFVTSGTHDALYCYDVTDPANPTPNQAFGTDGRIVFSDPANTVGGDFKPAEAYYMDADDDGTVWLVAEADVTRVMKISPDGSACTALIPADNIYCVEHVDGYLLLGDSKGKCIEVRNDVSYEVITKLYFYPDYGDRVTRIQVVNDVAFVCEAGSDDNPVNTIHAAPLSAEGQVFFKELVASMTPQGEGESDTLGTSETSSAGDAETSAEEPAETSDATQTPEQGTESSTEALTETPVRKKGCRSSVSFAAAALLSACAAFVVCKKD
jgi:hypothetical protein